MVKHSLVLLGLLVAGPAGAQDVAVVAGRVFTMDGEDRVLTPGMVEVQDGKITYVGEPREVPAGVELVEELDSWLVPGFVDLHTHIHGRGYNDMVHAVNPELRAGPDTRAGNPLVKRGLATGVTTLFGIPGSGTNMGGFGILYKARSDGHFERTVIADPGGLKVAQDSNPQRRNSTDFGITRAGMGWNLMDVNDKALAARRQGRKDPALEWLGQVLSGELPVLIHTAGSEGVVNTARMWRVTYPSRSILSHGSFDGWKVAEAVAEIGIPVNHGPRTMDWFSSRNGRINGSSAAYSEALGDDFSINTDSGVVSEEEFFLQAAMSARYGGDPYQMLRAVTINPARAIGLGDRVGSLEPGKDGDLVLRTGDPLDPRSHVERVWIEGELQYDHETKARFW